MLLTIIILDLEKAAITNEGLIAQLKRSGFPYFIISQKNGKKISLKKSWNTDQVPEPYSLLPNLLLLMISHPCFGTTSFIMNKMYSEIMNFIGIEAQILQELSQALSDKKVAISTFDTDQFNSQSDLFPCTHSKIQINIKDDSSTIVKQSLINLFQLSDHKCPRKEKKCIS